MLIRQFLILFFLLAISAGTVLGDGLFNQLPDDGSWVMYSVDGYFRTPDHKGEIHLQSWLRIASVGRLLENGEPCRWIEIENFSLRADGLVEWALNSQRQIWKILIPEKYLIKGASPIDHILRGWVQLGAKEPHEFGFVHEPVFASKINTQSFDFFLFPAMLSGPLREVKELKATEIDSKLGKVPCRGVSGNLKIDPRNRFSSHTECQIEYYFHSSSPFGVVTASYDVKKPESSSGRYYLKLIDFGKNAISEIPGSKNKREINVEK